MPAESEGYVEYDRSPRYPMLVNFAPFSLFPRFLDLHPGVFYYSGAATAAGQAYTGALLVSRDGAWPDKGEEERMQKAFDTCGIKMWELFEVRSTSFSIMCSA